MPTDAKMKEAIENLKKVDNKVIITHAAPEETMCIFHPNHPEEIVLKIFWNGYGRMSYIDIGIWTIYTVRRMCGGIKRYFGLM